MKSIDMVYNKQGQLTQQVIAYNVTLDFKQKWCQDNIMMKYEYAYTKRGKLSRLNISSINGTNTNGCNKRLSYSMDIQLKYNQLDKPNFIKCQYQGVDSVYQRLMTDSIIYNKAGSVYQEIFEFTPQCFKSVHGNAVLQNQAWVREKPVEVFNDPYMYYDMMVFPYFLYSSDFDYYAYDFDCDAVTVHSDRSLLKILPKKVTRTHQYDSLGRWVYDITNGVYYNFIKYDNNSKMITHLNRSTTDGHCISWQKDGSRVDTIFTNGGLFTADEPTTPDEAENQWKENEYQYHKQDLKNYLKTDAEMTTVEYGSSANGNIFKANYQYDQSHRLVYTKYEDADFPWPMRLGSKYDYYTPESSECFIDYYK